MTSGLFNPTFAATGIGDLTSKHGKLAQLQDTEAATYVDTTASIIYDAAPASKGNKWIVGRSIVIQKSDGSNWVCANIGSAERQLNVVERLLVRMPRSRGFRVQH